MMKSPINTIFREYNRKKDSPLNILTCPTHERYETGLAKTGHNFYAFRANGIKDWKEEYAKRPDNYFLLHKDTIPDYVDFDLVLSQNKFGQFPALYKVAKELRLPMISLEHTLPVANWDNNTINTLRNMRGDINVFISEYSINEWGWRDNNDTYVVHHGVDSELFKPNLEEGIRIPRHNHILSVVNDWVNRDYFCGFKLWQYITNNL